MTIAENSQDQPIALGDLTQEQDIDTLLNQFSHFGVHLGLERIQRLLASLGNPHQQVPIVHVAGSNGKGSVCAYLSAVLTHAGYRVGRYTSPHLVSWRERICLNEQPISSGDLQRSLLQAQAAIDPDHPSPTQFEVITAAAWLYFAQQKVDIAVVEVGLGGRLDATNVCDRPLVTVITSISREHWQRLGPTLADIAREKAGILKPGCPAVVGPLPPEAATVVEQRISELNCPALWPPPAEDLGQGWAEFKPVDPKSKIQNLKSLQYPLPLPGSVQLSNSALAIAALQILQQQGWSIPEAAIVEGMAKTQWPARLQWFKWQNHLILIDGAHNTAGAIALRQYVDTQLASGNWPGVSWVMGMINNKDHADVFKALLQKGDRLYLVPVPDHISADPNELAGLATEICPDLAACQIYPEAIAALEAANQDAPENLVVFCGSLYLIGHFFKLCLQSSSPHPS